MAETVTIDRVYFETLLRRAELHTTGLELKTPIDLPVVTIPKVDHDNLLQAFHEYSKLKEALYAQGANMENLNKLIHGGDPNGVGYGQGVLQRPSAAVDSYGTVKAIPVSQIPIMSPNVEPSVSFKSQANSYEREIIARRESTCQESASLPSELEKDEWSRTSQRQERNLSTRNEQRTVILKNLPDRVTHQDIVDIVRGGILLDITILRSSDRCASVSFADGAAAKAFLNHVKYNPPFIDGRRVDVSWNERQFFMPAHIGSKIQSGASRNLLIRNIQMQITPDRIREDLEHIHNLAVVYIRLKDKDAFVSLNSVHNALFARTCMMSRAAYKTSKIDYFPDECAQPLPIRAFPKRELTKPTAAKQTSNLNRFEMLSLDEDDESSEDGGLLLEEDGSPEHDESFRRYTSSLSTVAAAALNDCGLSLCNCKT